jgi:hypothetical protein
MNVRLVRRLALVAALMPPAAALANGTADPSFRIVNASGLVVSHLTLAVAGSGKANEDLLAGDSLPPGQAAAFRLAGPGCAWDIGVVYVTPMGELNETIMGFNTCAVRDLVLAGPPSPPTRSPGRPSHPLPALPPI